MKSKILNQCGVVSLPMILFSVLYFSVGISLWALLHHWKELVDTQLRLDRCTGKVALALESKLKTLESSNQQMKILRAAIAAAMSTYGLQETVPPLRIALHVEYVRQEWIGTSWMLQQTEWSASRGCGEKSDWALPLPTLQLERDPPDEIGEQALNLETLTESFHIEAAHLPRRSAATVARSSMDRNGIDKNGMNPSEIERLGDESEVVGKKSNWQAYWSAPFGINAIGVSVGHIGTSFR